MAHFYLVTSLISYTEKELNKEVIKPYQCTVAGDEKIEKLTQHGIKNISIFVTRKYLEESNLNPVKISDFNSTIMGINYLGNMSEQEFVDSNESVFKDLKGQSHIMVPTGKTQKPSEKELN